MVRTTFFDAARPDCWRPMSPLFRQQSSRVGRELIEGSEKRAAQTHSLAATDRTVQTCLVKRKPGGQSAQPHSYCPLRKRTPAPSPGRPGHPTSLTKRGPLRPIRQDDWPINFLRALHYALTGAWSRNCGDDPFSARATPHTPRRAPRGHPRGSLPAGVPWRQRVRGSAGTHGRGWMETRVTSWRDQPGPARTIGVAVSGAVDAALYRDPTRFEATTTALAALPAEQTGLVLGALRASAARRRTRGRARRGRHPSGTRCRPRSSTAGTHHC